MQYKIEISKKVEKFLEKHPDILSRYFFAIEILKNDPLPSQLDIKKLKGENSKYRIRIGKYRFLYEVKEHSILIFFFNAGSRGDIYK